jgi:putative hydrolase of the HAD superfamily
MPVRALMLDVDGVLVDGRPEDGRHWQTSLEADLGLPPAALREHFFAPYWDEIVTGRVGLMAPLHAALQRIAPHVPAATLVGYWFARDARVVASLLPELAAIRAAGIRVYLATNQEHLRAAYLMETLGLAAHVDGLFHSARVGAAKPHPTFFARVQAAVGLPGDELLLVDDTVLNVEAARAAGWRTLHWTADTAPEALRRVCGLAPATMRRAADRA